MSGKELKPGQPVLEKIWLGYTEKVFYKPMLFPDLASANAWKARAPKNYGEVFIKQYNLAATPPGFERVPEGTMAALETFLNKYLELIDSGDCGNWEPREEPCVIACLDVLARHRATKETPNAQG